MGAKAKKAMGEEIPSSRRAVGRSVADEVTMDEWVRTFLPVHVDGCIGVCTYRTYWMYPSM